MNPGTPERPQRPAPGTPPPLRRAPGRRALVTNNEAQAWNEQIAPLPMHLLQAPGPVYPLTFTNIRNVPEGSENAISMNAIANGNQMVNFHGNYTRGNRYYKVSTFEEMNRNRPLKRNPFTRSNIQPANARGYTARIVRRNAATGGRKTRKTQRKRLQKRR